MLLGSVPLVMVRWTSRFATPKEALVSALFLDEPWVCFVESPITILRFMSHRSNGRGGWLNDV
jgi:hypothetical protein